jgi:hypothetical protein
MTPEKILDCARATIAIVRHLDAKDEKLQYPDYAHQIGLIERPEDFTHGTMTLCTMILDLAAVADSRTGKTKLGFGRVVNHTGKPGAGFFKKRRIAAVAEV